MIDMSDITSMYSDVYASAANKTANQLKNQLEGTDFSKATDAELLAACKQFEAYFVEQMYKGMMKTIPQSDNTSNYTATMMDYYKDRMAQGVAEMTTEQTSLGLAQMLYEQMKRNYGMVDVIPGKEADTVTEDAADDIEEVDTDIAV